MTATLDAMLASRIRPGTLVARLAPWSTQLGRNIILMRSTGSQWLIDIERNAFQRLAPHTDAQRQLLSGTWTPYEELAFYTPNAVLVIAPQHQPALRTHIRPITEPSPTTQEGIPPPRPVVVVQHKSRRRGEYPNVNNIPRSDSSNWGRRCGRYVARSAV